MGEVGQPLGRQTHRGGVAGVRLADDRLMERSRQSGLQIQRVLELLGVGGRRGLHRG